MCYIGVSRMHELIKSTSAAAPDSQRLLPVRDAKEKSILLFKLLYILDALVTSTECFNFSPEHLLSCFKD